MLQVNSAQPACQVMLPQAEAVAMFAETMLIAVTPVEHAFKPLITTMVFGTAGWSRACRERPSDAKKSNGALAFHLYKCCRQSRGGAEPALSD